MIAVIGRSDIHVFVDSSLDVSCRVIFCLSEFDPEESEELYAKFVLVAPFAVQTSVSAIALLEKILTAI